MTAMLPSGSLKLHAYHHILRKLLSGDLPPGARLSNRALAAEIGISFIPVREAMSRLTTEGFVEHRPGIGVFVTLPSRLEIAELYDLREALECHAVTRAIQNLSQADLDEMTRQNDVLREHAALAQLESGWDPEQAEPCIHADMKIHMTILTAAGNTRVMRTVAELRVMSRILARAWQFNRPGPDADLICGHHAELIAALGQKERDAATEILRTHIQDGCQEALWAYDRWNGSSPRPANTNPARSDSDAS